MFLTPVALTGDLAIVFGWPGTSAFISVLLLLLGVCFFLIDLTLYY